MRALSLAGFASVPDIDGLGQHFLLFLKDKRLDLEALIMDPRYGYFSESTSKSLKVAFKMGMGKEKNLVVTGCVC